MSAPEPFGHRLVAAAEKFGPLCVGIDPHPHLLHSWGLNTDVAGLREFSLRTVAALDGTVGVVKPQSAFYEQYGSGGVAVLEEVVQECRSRGILCILDAKRGDIGSTMTAYAEAYLTEGSPLAADAVTLSPYLGVGALAEAADTAVANGRGVFVLCLTSNPEGALVQHARTGAGHPVAAQVAREVGELNQAERAGGTLGSAGLVVGATIGAAAAELGVDLAAVNGPLLAPGLGAQGGTTADLARVFAGALGAVVPTTSRTVLAAGPQAAQIADAAGRVGGMLKDLRNEANG